MLIESSNSAAGSAVTGAIQQASQATGTSFNYLLVEFGSQPACRASTSWARGLFKFAAIRPPIRSWPEPSPRPTLGVKPAARPSTQRGRTLYCALSRCRRCRTVDHAGLGPSQRQSRGFFRERRPGQFPDLLRPGHWRRPQRRAGAQCLTARYDVARCGQDRQTLTAQAVTAPTPAPAALDTAGIANAFAAAAPTLKPSDTAVFHGLFCRRQPHRAACTGGERALARTQRGAWHRCDGEAHAGRQRRARSLQGHSGERVVRLDFCEELW